MADVVPLDGFARVAPWTTGERAFSNRNYRLHSLPVDLPTSRFLQVAGGGVEPLELWIREAGLLLLAISDETPRARVKDLEAKGWRETEHLFTYEARRSTQMIIYQKRVPKGWLQLERYGWAGPMILVPPSP